MTSTPTHIATPKSGVSTLCGQCLESELFVCGRHRALSLSLSEEDGAFTGGSTGLRSYEREKPNMFKLVHGKCMYVTLQKVEFKVGNSIFRP
jgi:hypothetical protein